MQVYIKIINGKTFSLEVEENNTVAYLQNLIRDKENIPVEKQRLIFQGVPLLYNNTLMMYGIKNLSIIHLLFQIY
jgi:hypothetical protein